MIDSRLWRDRLTGHKARIVVLDGGFEAGVLFSLSADGACRLWDLERRCVVKRYLLAGMSPERQKLAHSWGPSRVPSCDEAVTRRAGQRCKEISAAAIFKCADEVYLAGGMLCGSVTVWNLTHDGEEVSNLHGHTDEVRGLFERNNSLYTSSLDRTVRIWKDSQCLQCLLLDAPVCQSFLTTTHIGNALTDGHIVYVDLAKSTEVLRVADSGLDLAGTASLSFPLCCAYVCKESVFLGFADGTIAHSKATGHVPCWRWRGHSDAVRCLAALEWPYGTALLSSDDRGLVKVWDAKETILLECIREPIGVVSLELSDTLLYTASSDCSIRTYELEALKRRMYEHLFMSASDKVSNAVNAVWRASLIDAKKRSTKKAKKSGKSGGKRRGGKK